MPQYVGGPQTSPALGPTHMQLADQSDQFSRPSLAPMYMQPTNQTLRGTRYAVGKNTADLRDYYYTNQSAASYSLLTLGTHAQRGILCHWAILLNYCAAFITPRVLHFILATAHNLYMSKIIIDNNDQCSPHPRDLKK